MMYHIIYDCSVVDSLHKMLPPCMEMPGHMGFPVHNYKHNSSFRYIEQIHNLFLLQHLARPDKK